MRAWMVSRRQVQQREVTRRTQIVKIEGRGKPAVNALGDWWDEVQVRLYERVSLGEKTLTVAARIN